MIIHSDHTRRPSPAGRRESCDPPSETSFGERLWARMPIDPTTRLPLQAVGITSSGRGEGVSTVALGLAQAAAVCGGPAGALLVDLSCWPLRPASAAADNPAAQPIGLSDVMAGVLEVDDAVQESSCEGLMLLSAGRQRVDRLDHDQRQQLDKLLGDLRQRFDRIVVDLPCLAGSDIAAPVAKLLDGVLVVVQAGTVEPGKAQRAVKTLRQAGARIAGAVLNEQRDCRPRWMQRWN